MLRRSTLPAIIALTLTAGVVGAQTESVPVLVPEPPAAAATDADSDTPQDRPATTWDYSIGVGGGYESNVGLQVSAPGPSDYSGSAFANLARIQIKSTSQTRFALGGSTFFYAEQTTFDRWDGDASFSGSWKLSPRTTGILGLAVGYGHTDTSRILSDQGLILPLTRTIDYAGSLGLSRQLSQSTDFRVSARAYRVDFPESDLYADSTSIRLGAGVDGRLGERSTLSAEYAAERLERVQGGPESEIYWTHYGSAVFRRILARGTSLGLRGGASYSTLSGVESTGQPWRFYGGVNLSRTVGRNNFTVYYSREVVPVFAVTALRFTDRVGLNAGIPMGRIWELSFGGYYMQDAESTESGDRLSSFDGTASLAARLSRRFWLSARGRYYRRLEFGDIPEIENYRVGLFLVFGSNSGVGGRY